MCEIFRGKFPIQETVITSPAPVRDRLINLKQLRKIWPVCADTVYRYIKKGLFPKPLKFGRSSLWWESTVYQALHDLSSSSK